MPIDGGISLLLIAGAAYGIYAIKKKNNVVVKRLKG
ncbi:PID-CTERM protein-sorting domain-containing protein [Lutibacter sp.]